ncbi:MAG: helix-turn-helix domain-containing protein [Rhodocyclaceae bacterium]|nr:helix-turn-helix domain-containing protein [Rhodocyclaceae bacterium]
MNLLALLERRMPPEIPMGAGRFISFDQEPQRAPAKAVTRDSRRADKQRASREMIMAAILSGSRLIREIQRYTGLCKSTVFNHCNVLAAEGLIEISSVKGVNVYTPKRVKGTK